jgi:hypothetical protein
MANKAKFTTQQVIGALQQTRGLVFLAAQLLHCTPETVAHYCQRHPSVEAAKVAARGEILDVAEERLFRAIQRDEAWAIAFCLKTLGRQRGYAETLDVSLTVRAAAAKVAAEFGLTPEAVLAEAKLLLQEVDHDAHGSPTLE